MERLNAKSTRTISLMSYVTKLVLQIVINRIRGRTLNEIAPVQYGFMPDKGVRQGCVASPHLFALYTEMIMRELDDMDGFRIGGTVVNNLRYADDTVIIGESEEQLQRLINVVVTKSEEKGLYLNSAKSFAMVFSKASQIPTVSSPQMQDVRRRSGGLGSRSLFYIHEQC